MRRIQYPEMVVCRCRSVALALLLVCGPAAFAQAQEPAPPSEDQQYEFFSGVVEDLPPGKITVSRSALGKTETRTFAINGETKIEGKLRTKVRVTVRFRKSDEGEVAVHIIVRG